MALQAGQGAFTGVAQEVKEVRSQVSALEREAGGLAEQVGPAVAALLAANPPYQPPPHDDKVTMVFTTSCSLHGLRLMLAEKVAARSAPDMLRLVLQMCTMQLQSRFSQHYLM